MAQSAFSSLQVWGACRPCFSFWYVSIVTHAVDGEMGYPGKLTARTTNRVDGLGLMIEMGSVEMAAITDASKVVNLVNQIYFNLAGRGAGPNVECRGQVLFAG